MHRLTFYPIGNADCCFVEVESGKNLLFDYADMRNSDDETDFRIDLKTAIKNKIKRLGKNYFDVVSFSHADKDHYNRFSELFYLKHAQKYQSEERIKINEMWVPASLICDGDLDDEGKILRSEARYRFKDKKDIKVISRPEVLKSWCEKEGLAIEDYKNLFIDAGRIMPGLSLEIDGIEVFVHSPFASRQDDGTLIDRNDCSTVVQLRFKSGELLTNAIISADTTYEAWEEIVKTSKSHKNEGRLKYDVFELSHHCSYLSLNKEKGKDKTTPTENVEWLYKQGNKRAILVSTSNPIPTNDDNSQPPHRQAANYYKDVAKDLEGDFVVTMEHPKTSNPEPVQITIDNSGATLVKSIASAEISLSSRKAHRVG